MTYFECKSELFAPLSPPPPKKKKKKKPGHVCTIHTILRTTKTIVDIIIYLKIASAGLVIITSTSVCFEFVNNSNQPNDENLPFYLLIVTCVCCATTKKKPPLRPSTMIGKRKSQNFYSTSLSTRSRARARGRGRPAQPTGSDVTIFFFLTFLPKRCV